MTLVVYAFLKDGCVFRDRLSYEEGDRIGTYSIIHDGDERFAETSLIGGKKYQSLWLWNPDAEEKGKGFGIVPMQSL